MGGLQFIFVHGLSGWGSYDAQYSRMPYWGMRGGDLMPFLREKGFACYAASVSPTGSAWDRACELYAQLAGTWNVYPVQDGDHMFLQGGLFHKHDIRPFYLEMLETIRKAEESK